MRFLHPLILPSLILSFACGGGEGGDSAPTDRTTARDSAGVRIVDNRVDGLPATNVAAAPSLRIGSLDGGPQELYQVRAVGRLSGGGWRVANSGTAEVRIFDADGSFQSAFGGRGEGPGEFALITTMIELPGDSVLIWDFRQRRASVFGPAGELGRTFTPETAEGQRVVTPTALVAPGVLFGTGSSTFGSDLQNETLARPDVTHSLIDTEGASISALGTWGGAEMWLNMSQDFVSVMQVPYAKESRAVVVGDKVIVGQTESSAFDVFDATGARVGSWRIEVEAPAVTDELWEAAIEEILDGYEDPEAAAEGRDTYDAMDRPERFPIWSDLHAGTDGTLWVQQFSPPTEEEVNRWWRLNADGRLMDQVELPIGFDPMWSDAEEIAGIVQDEFDVEYLEVLRVGN